MADLLCRTERRLGLLPGFPDAVRDAQATFRAVLAAMSRPGRVVPLPVLPACGPDLPAAALAVLLCLCDLETALWAGAYGEGGHAGREAAAYLAFHCGCPEARTPGEAAYALCDVKSLPERLAGLPLGTPEFPDRSATVVATCEALGQGHGVRIGGPGVPGEAELRVAGARPALWSHLRDLAHAFPRGLDCIFVDGRRVACLPRSARILEIL
ncbi:phosphonate C-P lyase system protein PhnH [Desulfovibrio sp. X2]|uniref:phosphonate C-P lyase system protein PhnH n=1 Tax=Desulfovibrio sp. X2 TaxID=941449 RepID=UPI00035893C8|nr:phosphonate C-P lyase system protein PhnH [Desulfovibrio sp. X2]EPR43823.1 phosphonate C-P lyase system protein PhnH [Desulfovibrio sp. X2]